MPQLSTRDSAAAAHRPHETMGLETTAGDNIGSSATLFHDRNGGFLDLAAPAALAFSANEKINLLFPKRVP